MPCCSVGWVAGGHGVHSICVRGTLRRQIAALSPGHCPAPSHNCLGGAYGDLPHSGRCASQLGHDCMAEGGARLIAGGAPRAVRKEAILDPFPPMATVTAVTTVFPCAGLLRFVVSPKTQRGSTSAPGSCRAFFFPIPHSCLFLPPHHQTIWSTFSPCRRIWPILCTQFMTMARVVVGSGRTDILCC